MSIHGLYGCGVDQRPALYFKDRGYYKKCAYFLLVFYPDSDDWQCVAYSKSLSYIFRRAKKYLKMNCSVKIFDDREIASNFSFMKASSTRYRSDYYKDFYFGIKTVKEEEYFDPYDKKET